jgi:dihydrofolate reductase
MTSIRHVILNLAVSLDGFIEGPHGEFDWCMTDQDYGMSAFLNSTDTILFGRKSYELLTAIEPDAYTDMVKYVFSNSLQEVQHGFKLISGNTREQVNRIKHEPGKKIWLFGGAKLTSSLLQDALVDELMLSVHPIILGKGKPLFSDLDKRIPLEFSHSINYAGGLVQLYYRVIKLQDN